MSEANSLERGESPTMAKNRMHVGDPYAVAFMLGGNLMRDDSESEKEILGGDCSKNQESIDLEAEGNEAGGKAEDTQSRDDTI